MRFESRKKQKNNVETLCSAKIYFTVILIGSLVLLPQGLTQRNDDVYIVQPTSSIRFGKEELTTVLLVNNDHHGCCINLRSEVGLLTSTARTFIQEGVTTEYGTQVLGTTLDNGRVYAQYLKKSSRILYHSGSSVPSVVTSWVGESLHSNAYFLPQSHNDLFDVNQADWQAIDDTLQGDHQHNGNFVSNVDYVGLQNQPSLTSDKSELKPSISSTLNADYITNSKHVHSFISQLRALTQGTNKVLTIEDLPTYTIKQNYEPSILEVTDAERQRSEYDAIGRQPKLMFEKPMASYIRKEYESAASPSPISKTSLSRQFTTVTYYGFADFTTVVGESIIIFSPSTSTNQPNYANITSIKGEATVGSTLAQEPRISKVPIKIIENIIEPTTTQKTVEIMSEPVREPISEAETATEPNENICTDTNSHNGILETTETEVQQSQIEISSAQLATIVPTVMLSRPSDEEILRIFSSLANADAENLKLQTQSIEHYTAIITEETAKTEEYQKSSNDELAGGATTIYFEDDPFANFVVPSNISLGINFTNPSYKTDDIISKTTSFLSKELQMDDFSTNLINEITYKSITTIEMSPNLTLEIFQKNFNADISNTLAILESVSMQSSTERNKSRYILPNMVIKEIDPNSIDEFPSNCINTSQVYLSDLKTEVRQHIKPTYEIKEVTKLYCTQTSITEIDQIKSALEETSVSSNENGDLDSDVHKVYTQSYEAEATEKNNDDDKIEGISRIEENSVKSITERLSGIDQENTNEYTVKNQGGDTGFDDEHEDLSEEAASGQWGENDEDEEIELIYKTLYTTYTYLTTFFSDDSTSISDRTDIVTNVMTSTLGGIITNTKANILDNEISPSSTLDYMQLKSPNRFDVLSEVERFIRTGEKIYHESQIETTMDNLVVAQKKSETLATFHTTYTYYTTIFAEGGTEVTSHSKVVTNIIKSSSSPTLEVDRIKPTALIQSSTNPESVSPTVISFKENNLGDYSLHEIELNSTLRSVEKLAFGGLSSIPDLDGLSAITLFTDVRFSSSPGNKEFIKHIEAKSVNDKYQQQKNVYEDQISSESNTDTDEIMLSATLLLQTSFTTFTYYTTMYSADKTNIISRLETMISTVTETLQPSKAIKLEAVFVPITYFTTFTYWTKLARDGQITTLSREEVVSNVIAPTAVQHEVQSEVLSLSSKMNDITKSAATLEGADETITKLSKEENSFAFHQSLVTKGPVNTKTSTLEPTTYYTTYTYYTTSYETDKTVTYSRFETVTNIFSPTATITHTGKHVSRNFESLESPTAISFLTVSQPHISIDQSTSYLVLYELKKIIDAEGISTLFFTTEIQSTLDSLGSATEITSSSSSLFKNEDRRSIQAKATAESYKTTVGPDRLLPKQYKTGLVRLIEGTRIANQTTTLYQSKVIGTIIDQRYAQIIESTSSFIFDKTKAPTNLNIPVSSTIFTSMQNIIAADQVGYSIQRVESSINDSSTELEVDTTSKLEVEVDEENSSKMDLKLRFPLHAKKPPHISSLKPLSNRGRPQLGLKKNSRATIITRNDFTPTITATPALKTVGRFSSTRQGSASISGSNPQLYATSFRRFVRPSKSSIFEIGGIQPYSSLGAGLSRNKFVSSLNTRNALSSSSKRLGDPNLSTRPSFLRQSLFSTGFSANSRIRIRPSSTVDLGGVSTNVEISSLVLLNSQEEGISTTSDETEKEKFTIESNRRQNISLLRLRRPLNKPQAFTSPHTQSNLVKNAVSLRRNPLSGRSRNGNGVTVARTTTTTTKPKARTFHSPLFSQNRIRPANTLYPLRNIFAVQKEVVQTKESTYFSDEDRSENNDYSEYEDEDDEFNEEEENKRRRRSNTKIEHERHQIRVKRKAENSHLNRGNFRNRVRRPNLASSMQTESRTNEDDGAEFRKLSTTVIYPVISTHRIRARFGTRYSGHSSSSSTTATLSELTTSNHKAIRPTRPASSNGRAQFTLREKELSSVSTLQKSSTSTKRPVFRKPQPGNSISSRRLPSSTVPPSTAGKRRHKIYTSSDSTTSRNSVTGKTRTSSTTSSRSRISGPSRDSNLGSRSRGRNTHNHNSANDLTFNRGGTIIVTHFIPAEVTIPVVNGKVTEYKQVVTAKTSTEALAPLQYTTSIATNGRPYLVLVREDSSVNYKGATEFTRYILHEMPTSTITFTPTTIRGRKTSFSHVLPSTVYSVEQVISTFQPHISANAPLANILLSQLLLGNVGLPPANPFLGALGGAFTQPVIGLGAGVGTAQPPMPVTEYKTHASTYVTTIFEGQSTVLPVTFHGKKIITTVFDTTAQTITATEFITDTIVTTPTIVAQSQPVVNSLLLQQLLLQQHLQQQQIQQPTRESVDSIGAVLNSVSPHIYDGGDNLQELEAPNIRGSGNNDINDDDDLAVGSSIDFDDIALISQVPQNHKNGGKKARKSGKNYKRKNDSNTETHHAVESSIITLYVSGRRPGEFSTVLSTVQVRPDFTQYKRHAHTLGSLTDYLNDGSDTVNEYFLLKKIHKKLPPEIILLDNNYENYVRYEDVAAKGSGTQSLESIVGDVSSWYATQEADTWTTTIKFAGSITKIKNQISSSHVTDSDDSDIQTQVN